GHGCDCAGPVRRATRLRSASVLAATLAPRDPQPAGAAPFSLPGRVAPPAADYPRPCAPALPAGQKERPPRGEARLRADFVHRAKRRDPRERRILGTSAPVYNLRMFQRLALAATACALCLAAQTPDNAAMQSKLRAEETAHSQVMEILHQITDVHGPRLTGSPGLKAADDWAVATMSSWGLANAHLEGWNFGHPGWANALVEANVLVPYQAPLEVRPLAWSPGTRGAITAPAVLLTVPGLHASAGRRGSAEEQAAAQAGSDPPPMPAPEAAATAPTLAELDAYLNTMREKVRGAIVLAGTPVHVDEVFFPAPLRTPDEQWQARFSGQGGG